MFNLIISIIAIALVVALAGASLYYGGEAFNRGSEDAKASTYINQVQQVQAAATLYAASEGGSATSINDTTDAATIAASLVGAGYMSGEPKLAAGPASDQWGLDATENVIFVSQVVSASAKTGITNGICDTINDNGAGVVKCAKGAVLAALSDLVDADDTDDATAGVQDNLATVGDSVTVYMAL